MTIPTLETRRLILRGHSLEDFDASFAMWSDPQVVRWIGGRPYSEEEVWSRLLRYAGHWALLGFGYWVVVEKSSGRFVGEVGFGEFRREIHPSLQGTPEMGWCLAGWTHGQGFATEAVLEALVWSDAHFETAQTVCLIDPENFPSMRVAEKSGYRKSGVANYKERPTVLLHRSRDPA